MTGHLVNLRTLFLLCGITLLSPLYAQNLKYIIQVSPLGRSGVLELPSEIDSSHYYSHDEIQELAQPAQGWYEFYESLETLEYPTNAASNQSESSITVVYRISETGKVDSVYVYRHDRFGLLGSCASCEAVMINFIQNTTWLPGKIRDVTVKTEDYIHVLFLIRDPKKPVDPFGY